MAACCSRSLDFNVPLHVDCSVEYDLPSHAKPPPGVRMEPLLMIHPCHFRRLEIFRRRPYVNGMLRRRMKPYQHPWEMQPLPSYHQTYNHYNYEMANYSGAWHARYRMTPYSQHSACYEY